MTSLYRDVAKLPKHELVLCVVTNLKKLILTFLPEFSSTHDSWAFQLLGASVLSGFGRTEPSCHQVRDMH